MKKFGLLAQDDWMIVRRLSWARGNDRDFNAVRRTNMWKRSLQWTKRVDEAVLCKQTDLSVRRKGMFLVPQGIAREKRRKKVERGYNQESRDKCRRKVQQAQRSDRKFKNKTGPSLASCNISCISDWLDYKLPIPILHWIMKRKVAKRPLQWPKKKSVTASSERLLKDPLKIDLLFPFYSHQNIYYLNHTRLLRRSPSDVSISSDSMPIIQFIWMLVRPCYLT